MLVRPCIQNVPGKNGELIPSGYSLQPLESGPEFVQGPGGVTAVHLRPCWSRLGVEPAELSESAVDHGYFRSS